MGGFLSKAAVKEFRFRLDQVPAAARAQRHPASFAAMGRSIVRLSDQFSMPSQQSLRHDNGSDQLARERVHSCVRVQSGHCHWRSDASRHGAGETGALVEEDVTSKRPNRSSASLSQSTPALLSTLKASSLDRCSRTRSRLLLPRLRNAGYSILCQGIRCTRKLGARISFAQCLPWLFLPINTVDGLTSSRQEENERTSSARPYREP